MFLGSLCAQCRSDILKMWMFIEANRTPVVDLSRLTANLMIIGIADVLKIGFETNFIIKKQNTVIEREQYL
ncbi:hypothetical protein CXF79_14125 [Colwellia sp. Bg11-28]|nr:hypothetical protein CXF79_14125 [Colwellia sp. Bg11-28]